MFDTPITLLEIQQLRSCSRPTDGKAPKHGHEVTVTIRGRRRNGRNEAEPFEETLLVDVPKLAEARTLGERRRNYRP